LDEKYERLYDQNDDYSRGKKMCLSWFHMEDQKQNRIRKNVIVDNILSNIRSITKEESSENTMIANNF
jgi:hypothetical protein